MHAGDEEKKKNFVFYQKNGYGTRHLRLVIIENFTQAPEEN